MANLKGWRTPQECVNAAAALKQPLSAQIHSLGGSGQKKRYLLWNRKNNLDEPDGI